MLGYQHYVRTDNDGKVLHAFSSAFEKPVTGDVLINGNAERHFPVNILNTAGEPTYELVDGNLTYID